MNRKQTSLSPDGQLRKREMLDHLQSELVQIQQRKNGVQRFIAIGFTVCFCAITISLIESNFENSSEGGVANPESVANSPVVRPAPFSEWIETNREDVVARYVDSKKRSKLSFTTLTDEGLVDALESSGSSMVLGEIAGKLVLIPTNLIP